MEDDGQTYILPHPMFARVMMTVAGVFAIVVVIYELWRGVWPLNFASPFFGFIILGGITVGAGFVWAGLVTPNIRLVFQPGLLQVYWQFLIGLRRSTFRAADIQSIDVVEDANSDGPNDWHAVIRIRGSKPLRSRPLGTKETAEKLAGTFREKLGLPDTSAL